MTVPRAVLLDLDDTLYPERDYVVSGIGAVARFLACRPELNSGLSSEEISAKLLGLLNHGRGELFDRMLNLLGIHSASLVSTLVHVYRTHLPTLSLCGDVLPAIARFRESGLLLGIVTDGKACMQKRKLEALALMDQVEAIVCSDDLFAGCAKPSTVPFEVALCHLQVPPEAAVYIGDDLSKDFLGPRKLGMRTIRLDRSLPHPLQPRTDFPDSHQAEVVCRDLSEAASWLFEDR